MKKLLLCSTWCCFYYAAFGQCTTAVDFSTWTKGGQPANGNWVLQNGNTQVHQTVNGDPTFFYSPFDLMNVEITGNFKSTDDDDDYMGFVFSFLNPLSATDSFDCWLFDWKQAPQQAAPKGMSLDRVLGVIPSAQYTNNFWNHTNSAAFTVVDNNFGSAGWVRNFNHAFKLDLTYNRATIYVDGVLKFDHQDCYKVGKFGFYNLSQQDCYYSNFQYSLFIDFVAPTYTCKGVSIPLTFIPNCGGTVVVNQYSSIKWDYGDGTTNTITNPNAGNANAVHTYSTPGTYTVTLTVTDNNGCTASKSYPVKVLSPITLTPTLTPPPCNGGSNGSVVLTPAGGQAPFTYTWSAGGQGNTLAGVPAGTYAVSVTDGYCNTTAQYTLGQPSALSATTSHTNASCSLNNGSATIAITGGTPPYNSVSWAGTPGYTVTGLGAGTYIAQFKDANGCSALLQYTETVGSNPCGINSSVTTSNVSCFGGSNGSGTLTVTGSTGTPLITWSTGATGATVSNLAAGTYTYTYSDANNAHAFNGSVVITQPGAAMVLQLATTGITCPGATDGQAVASVTSGGHTPYTYTWSRNPVNNAVNSGLSPGAINVTVTDSLGCSATAAGNISSVPSLATSFVTVIDSCYHSGKGKATVTVAGGSPPYTYAWSNFYTDTANTSLIAGTYTLTVTDSKHCSVTGTSTIGGPATVLNAPYTFTDIKCYGDNNGSFTVATTGGTPGYTYTWTPATASGANPTGLAPGIYAYTVTDAYHCTAIGGDTITTPASALTATTNHVNVSCNGGSDGKLIITLGGGTPHYTYQGFPFGPGTDTIPNQPAGTYTGTVTDSNGCTANLSETITQPGPQSLTLATTNLTCYNNNTGTATANFVNGTGAVTYNWSPGGALPAARTGLPSGTYAVTATDANHCTVSNTGTITQPTPVVMQAVATNIACNGGNTGNINLTLSGGTGNTYTYTWQPNVSATNSASNLAAGTYAVTAADQNGCQADSSFTLTQPNALTATAAVINVNCGGAQNGSVTVTATGGAPNYTYTWNPNISTTNTATGLSGGNYAITITDANNCTVGQTATVTEPAALAATQSQTNVLCYGATTGSATVTISNGTTPYTYSWSPNVSTTATANNITGGAYTVTATDAHTCTISATFTITSPSQILMTAQIISESCHGGNTGSISLSSAGGAGSGYIYAWNPNVSNTNSAGNLTAGPYTVTVTDQAACTADSVFNVTEPLALTANTATTNITCNGAGNGTVTITAAGGTVPYGYSWSPNTTYTGNAATGLQAGTYSITVTDANACTLLQSGTVTEPPVLTLTQSQTDLLCYQVNNGVATVSLSGGNPPYTYTWAPNVSTAASATNLAAGNYSVTATDASTCAITATFTLSQPTQLTATDTHTDNACFGNATGQIMVTANGGTGTLSYSWSPNTTNTANIAGNLAAATYTYTVTDANVCAVSHSVTIAQPAQIGLTATPAAVVCYGQSNGGIVTTVNGGNQPFAYELESNSAPGQTSSTGQFSNLAAGLYEVVVTDAHGCADSIAATVTTPQQVVDINDSINVSCFGLSDGSITIHGSGGAGNYQFALAPGANGTNNIFSGLPAGSYTTIVTDANGCSATQITTLTQPDSFALSLTPVTASVKLGDTLQLTATANQNGVTYSWQPVYGLSCSDCPNPVFSANTSANYIVTAISATGCSAEAAVDIIVNPDYDIFFPNAFTPNGDGKNDIFTAYTDRPDLKYYDLKIFNRIGEKVFESHDISQGWDGTYKGQPAPAGVYLYAAGLVWLDNHANTNYKGSLTLLK